MPKIGVEFRKRYVIEATNETEAIKTAEQLLAREFGDNNEKFSDVFEILVVDGARYIPVK